MIRAFTEVLIATPGVDISIVIVASPGEIVRAFFDGDALSAWWQVRRSVTTPRPLGPYALEWGATDFRDDVLGRLGGVFRGTVLQCDPGHGFFVADCFWLPPDGDPIGPMALEVNCAAADPASGTRVHVRQSGFEEGARWRRYYEVAGHGWERALSALRALLEK
ncbi:MAG TPA: SRPBCC domain-containing protein [Vicinamibacterales bacterium]|nr:SRPBCC domain-containing protein [Vicinamibacterales bacterium]